MVADINFGDGAAAPGNLTVMNGKLYFSAYNGEKDGLWVTDGTQAGTQMVEGTNAPNHLIVMNNKLYFAAKDSANDNELWVFDPALEVSDATGSENPKRVANIRSDGSSNPHSFVLVKNWLYFAADSINEPARLWKTDGTEQGTSLVVSGARNIANLTLLRDQLLGDRLYFSGTTTANGAEPWVYNISTNSGAMIKDINTYDGQASNSSNPSAFFSFNGLTFFIANHAGFENTIVFFHTNGSGANTSFVNYVFPAAPIAFHNELFFMKGNSGQDWVSFASWNGEGTGYGHAFNETFTDFQVKADGPRVVIGGKLYFQGRETDESTAGSLWMIDSSLVRTSILETNYQLLGGSDGKAWFINSILGSLWQTDYGVKEFVVSLPTLN